ncbi:hypothetical protein HYDPIDRAFT_29128 [Hydnomerulius pinastri MD-312]|uniref:G domain-containing protein n=1 Tax=Hydnomerulius pinastri MD-312 TaxID=994086 RepID=A0A0C9VE29_9AGAM|nr:hypothetical protein HYDPIDRAFT_29128 [Hydnomerulius pinastri MD-312]
MAFLFCPCFGASVETTITEPADDTVVIAVIGPTGSGKSSFISKAAGNQETEVGHANNISTRTTEVVATKFKDPESGFTIVLVDTPDFGHNTTKLLSDWLKKNYDNRAFLSAVLYFHRISDNRVVGTPLVNIGFLKQLCREQRASQIILTTTMWDSVEESTGRERLSELKSDYWKTIIEEGSRTFSYLDTKESARELMRMALENQRGSLRGSRAG